MRKTFDRHAHMLTVYSSISCVGDRHTAECDLIQRAYLAGQSSGQDARTAALEAFAALEAESACEWFTEGDCWTRGPALSIPPCTPCRARRALASTVSPREPVTEGACESCNGRGYFEESTNFGDIGVQRIGCQDCKPRRPATKGTRP